MYRTHHGPVVREKDGRWVSVALMQKPVEALSQSYLLTKARTYAEFMKTMELRANSSNNTVYADRDGNIAYLHPQFIPRRDDRFDYTRPVDGADPATDWQGLHALDDAPHFGRHRRGAGNARRGSERQIRQNAAAPRRQREDRSVQATTRYLGGSAD